MNMQRRQFLATAVGGVSLANRMKASPVPALTAGEGVADITPPLGIEMGGFHRPPGRERKIRAIRQACAARALMLGFGNERAVVCSLDALCVSEAMAERIRKEAAARTGVRPENIRVAATHDHSMPTFKFVRQWGAMPEEFMAVVERRTVEAIVAAKEDLSPAQLLVGKCRASGASHNRTVKPGGARADADFGQESTDAERWLDTMLHAMVFRRSGRPDLVWYHFSAHAVCYADDEAGPDWPGEVAARIHRELGIRPSFLQGHSGDVNPGDGSDWRGEIHQTVKAIAPALRLAIETAEPRNVDCLKVRTAQFDLPFDMKRFSEWVEEYRRDPGKCNSKQWVDAGFAADWYRCNEHRELKDHLPITLAAMQIGPVGLVFHPAELYGCYGLLIRRDSPLPDTLVVGYADGSVGYLPDPKAYELGEYSALVVPKILDLPPFQPTTARQMTAAAIALLKQTIG